MTTLPPPATRWRPRLSRSGPRYLALVDAIAEGMARGELHRGDRLPTQRQLARMLDLNLATVTRGIAEAERRGLVEAQQGRGTFVVEELDALPDATIDLTLNLPAEPAGSSLPRRFAETTARLLAGEGARQLLRYPEMGGGHTDRAAGAAWLARRGIELDADRVVLSDGADHAILLALTALAPRDGRILVEDLSYSGIRTMAGMLNLAVEGLATDGDGLRPDAFERAAARGPSLLVLTPTFHNPTTRTMPEARRREIVRVARRHGVPIIEDDVYGFFPVEAPPAFAVLAPERTAYLTSFSKCFAPGLRVGYLASGDAAIAERLAAAARATTCTPAALAAAVASRWIVTGVLDEALVEVRNELLARDALCQRLLVPGPDGGGTCCPHRWLELPDGWHRSEFIERARQHGVAVRGSDAFAVDRAPPDAVRFSISAPRDQATLERALLVLARTLREPHAMRRAVV